MLYNALNNPKETAQALGKLAGSFYFAGTPPMPRLQRSACRADSWQRHAIENLHRVYGLDSPNYFIIEAARTAATRFIFSEAFEDDPNFFEEALCETASMFSDKVVESLTLSDAWRADQDGRWFRQFGGVIENSIEPQTEGTDIIDVQDSAYEFAEDVAAELIGIIDSMVSVEEPQGL